MGWCEIAGATLLRTKSAGCGGIQISGGLTRISQSENDGKINAEDAKVAEGIRDFASGAPVSIGRMERQSQKAGIDTSTGCWSANEFSVRWAWIQRV